MAVEHSIVEGVAGRYATALFELARDEQQLEPVEGDLSGFLTLLDESEDLSSLVTSPLFSTSDRTRALSAVLEKAGTGPLVSNFLKLIAENGRLFAVGDMIKAFSGLLSRHRGEVTAEVASASELTTDQEDMLRKALKEAVGRTVQLDSSVDPSLLGGLVVKVGSRMIDSSLHTKLNNLKLAMKEVG